MPRLAQAPHVARALRVEIDDDPSSLHRLAPAWSELRRRAPHATVFQDPSWLIPWHETLGGAPLRLLTVWDGPRLVALAPLQLWTDAHSVKRLLLLGTGITDYCDVLLDVVTEGAPAVLADALRSLRREATETRFEALRPEAAIWRLAGDGGMATAQAPCPVRFLSTAWSKRAMRRLVLSRNRAERRGAVRIEFARSPDAIEHAMEALFRLHRARWESRGEPGVLGQSSLECFHRAVSLRAGAAGLLRLATLSIGGRIAAAYYGFADGGMAAGYLTGMDPEFAFESPGSLLLHHVVDRMRDEGCQEFHFLRGEELYKQVFADEARWNRLLVWTGA